MQRSLCQQEDDPGWAWNVPPALLDELVQRHLD